MTNDVTKAVTELLTTKLQSMKDKSLSRGVCIQIYQEIFDTLATIVSATDAKITNEGLNYLAQAYYDATLVNGRSFLDPNIFTQRAKLENIPTPEIVLMTAFVNKSDFAIDLIKEIKRRS